jgi:hypothetical protein
MSQLKFRDGFDWQRVAWGRPDSPRRNLCSYCHGALPECPLMMWKDDGSAVQFCDDCVDKWITVEQRMVR